MSSTTIVTTWSDLYTALLNDVRTETGVTYTSNLAKRYIDEAHRMLYIGHGEKFHWAERRAKLRTHAEYTTGTLTGTIGNTGIVGSGTLWNTNNDHGQANMRAGGKICIAGQDEVYTVSTVISDILATLDVAYIGASEAGLSYRYFEDEYALASDFLKPIDSQSFDDNRRIHFIGRSRFRQLYPRNRITSTTINVATWQDYPPDGNTTPIRKVRFGPAPSNVQIIPYSYVTSNIVVASNGTAKASFTADTDEPTMPLSYRPVIVLGAKMNWYRDIKDDQRSLQCQALYSQMVDMMIGDQDVGAQKLRIRSSQMAYRQRARNPYHRLGRAYDTNGRFDRFEDES
jgi:hypothetical protein